jgi:hypothetical protein
MYKKKEKKVDYPKICTPHKETKTAVFTHIHTEQVEVKGMI